MFIYSIYNHNWRNIIKKNLPQQAEVAQGVPGRLRPRIFLTFGTTRVVGRHPYAPVAFTPGEIPGTYFQRLSRTQGTWFRREPLKKSPVTPPRIDHGTSRLVAQCLNHRLQSGTHLHTQSTYTHQMLCCRITTLTFTFLTNFKISNFNKEHMSSLKMI